MKYINWIRGSGKWTVMHSQHVTTIKQVLIDCGIDSKAKQQKLKFECETWLATQAKPYNSVSNRIFDMLIGVPLGGHISSFMYKDGSNTLAAQIVTLIMLGFIIIGCAEGVKTLTYYLYPRASTH